MAKVAPFFCPTTNDTQKPPVNQGMKRFFHQWREIGIDRVELEDNHMICDKELVQEIGDLKRRGISGSKYQGYRSPATPFPIDLSLRL